MPNSSSPSTGMVTICMDKQKYSAAAGFHIQLFHSPPLQSQGKATAEKQQVRQHHPTGHQLDCSELFLKRVFSSYYLCRKLHPSLSPFLLSPASYSFKFLEANRKGSQSLQEGHLPRRFCPPSDSHPSSSVKLR